jgi:hypothetical protein
MATIIVNQIKLKKLTDTTIVSTALQIGEPAVVKDGSSYKLYVGTDGTTGGNQQITVDLTLGELTNVLTSGATNGQVLTYNGTNWIPQTVATTLAGLTDVSLTSLADGESLKWDATAMKWINFVPSTITDASDVIFDNSLGLLTATDVQGALDELSVTKMDLAPMGGGTSGTGSIAILDAGGQANPSGKIFTTTLGSTASASDNLIPTEKAVRDALDASIINMIEGTGTSGEYAVFSNSNTLTSQPKESSVSTSTNLITAAGVKATTDLLATSVVPTGTGNGTKVTVNGEGIVTNVGTAAIADLSDGSRVGTLESDMATAQSDITDLQNDKLDANFASTVLTSSTWTQNASVVQNIVSTIDPSTGNPISGSPHTTPIQTASPTQIGLMSAADVIALQQAILDIAALQGATTRYMIDLDNIDGTGTAAVDPQNPTQGELQIAYEHASGTTGVAQDGVILVDPNYGLSFQWFATSNEWVSLSSAQIQIATTTAPGIVLSTEDDMATTALNAGKVYVELNGAMSVIGWDILNSEVSDNTTAIGNKQDKLSGTAGNVVTYGASAGVVGSLAVDSTITTGTNNLVTSNAVKNFVETLTETIIDGTPGNVAIFGTNPGELDELAIDTVATSGSSNLITSDAVYEAAEGAKPLAGTGISITGTELTTVNVIAATSSTLGGVTVGAVGTSNITLTVGGAISVASASQTVKGVIQQATDAQVVAGTDTTTAVSPAQLQDKIDEAFTGGDTAALGLYNIAVINGLVTQTSDAELGDLSDVSNVTATNDQMLTYNGTSSLWEPQTLTIVVDGGGSWA